MLNTRLFNIHDIILIGSIVVIVHIVARPLLERIGATKTDDGGG